MFSHIMIGTNDVERAKTFYDAVLGTLGRRRGISMADGASSIAPRPGCSR